MERRNARSKAWTGASMGGAVFAAFASSLCCLGPLIFAALGIGGAGLVVKLTPYRTPLAAATLVLLATGFFFAYRSARAPIGPTAEGRACACELPRASRIGRVMLWAATVLVLALLSFPYLTPYLFD